jgi:hypothetical protein
VFVECFGGSFGVFVECFDLRVFWGCFWSVFCRVFL